MRFAITYGRAGPRPGDVVSSAGALDRLIDGALRQRTARLWEFHVDLDDGPAHRPLCRWQEPGRLGREAFAGAVRTAALSEARYGYLHGDCWHLAAVAGTALARPVAVMMAPCHEGEGCPDHLAVDLGDGLYLDVRGVLDEAGLAEGLQPGSRIVSRMPADEVGGLFDRLFPEGGEVQPWKESHAGSGFEEETRALFGTFLEAEARAVLERAIPQSALTIP